MVDFQERETSRGLDGAGEDTHGDDGDGEESDHGADAETAHEHHGHDLAAANVAVVTVSSTRTLEDDPAGDAVAAALRDAGHEAVTREVVGDDRDRVRSVVTSLVDRADVDCVVTTGGTGVTPDDVTVEAVEPLLEKRLPGFGELFRSLSREEIGTRVVATRATAGVADGVPVFCLPGSEDAARLGASEVIAPEVGHLAGLARRPSAE